MNQIKKLLLTETKGLSKTDLPARDAQRKDRGFPAAQYRKLTADELEVLVKNNNTAADWDTVLVSDDFDPLLVRHCNFSGVVRIGKLERIALEFHKLVLPVGLYDSTIVDCDFGENACIHHVNYLSRYIIGKEVMVANVNELATTDVAKFGNGILSENETESGRIWMELRNENGGRKILPFENMLPQDAWMWSSFRADEKLMEAFVSLTERKHQAPKNRYGIIGDRSVIKNCRMIKDVTIGTDAYLKGANKIKNVTLHSSAEAPSQIGEGCELVNGIIGEGTRIFYGVKAVRFLLASHSQLKYGARLINSYLGNNSTISCCEVLNALIFPFHEQHHNNSFLCASMLMGQSNMAGRGLLEKTREPLHPKILMLTKEERWEPASEPLHFDKSIAGAGLGASFSLRMSAAEPQAMIGLVPCAVGGTPLSRWQKGADLYEQALKRIRAAQKAGIVRGVLWHQGENDALDLQQAESYGRRLAEMVNDLRQDTGNSQLPFVAGTLGDFLSDDAAGNPSHWRTVNAQLLLLPGLTSRTAIVDASGLKPKSDGVHFDTPSLRTLGERYATAMLKLQQAKVENNR